jgi:hypothetical protein
VSHKRRRNNKKRKEVDVSFVVCFFNTDFQLELIFVNHRRGESRGQEEPGEGASRTRASVISAHNEVGGTVVLADDGVPQGLPRTSHTHGQRQKGQRRQAIRVVLHHLLVAPHSRVVVNVT